MRATPHVEFLHRITWFQLDALGLGALIAVAFAIPYLRQAAIRFSRPPGTAAITLAVLLWISTGTRSAQGLFGLNLGPFSRFCFQFLLTVSFAGLLIECLKVGSRAAGLFKTEPLISFGKYSYAIYVFHFPISLALASYLHARGFSGLVFQECLGIGLSYLAGLVSWKLFEERILVLKERFAY